MIILIGLDNDLAHTIRSETGVAVSGYVSPTLHTENTDLAWLESDQSYRDEFMASQDKPSLLVTMDNCEKRFAITQFFHFQNISKFISNRADISSRCSIGKGCIIQKNVLISDGCTVGNCVKFNVDVSVHHDCQIGDYCTLAPGARLLGGVQIGSRVFIGANATILPGISIDDGAVVGAGALVTKNISKDTLVVGVPARALAK